MNTAVSQSVDVLTRKGIVCMGLCFNKKLPLLSCQFDGGREDKTRLNSMRLANLIKHVFFKTRLINVKFPRPILFVN